mgnify:CR=1 FL=1
MSLDILFIHPNASKKIYQGLSNEHSAIEPPIWAGMLANHCKNKNHDVKILDCEVEKLDYIKSSKEITFSVSIPSGITNKVEALPVVGLSGSSSSIFSRLLNDPRLSNCAVR